MMMKGFWRRTHLDDGLGDEGVEVGHQLAVDVGHVEVLSNDGDEAHRPVSDPQVGVTQERSYGNTDRTKVHALLLVRVHPEGTFSRGSHEQQVSLPMSLTNS